MMLDNFHSIINVYYKVSKIGIQFTTFYVASDTVFFCMYVHAIRKPEEGASL